MPWSSGPAPSSGGHAGSPSSTSATRAAYPDDYSQPADYHAFYRDRRPLAGMHVYFAFATELPGPHFHARRPMFLTPVPTATDADRRAGLQVWTAAYGQLVVQVVPSQDARLTIPVRD